MQHQDWDTVIVKGNVSTTKKPTKKVITTPGNKQDTVLTIKKEYDPDHPNAEPEIRAVLIDKEFSRKMIQARVAKGLSQVQLARSCMLDVKIINEYEKGGCARNGSYITKIKKVLGNF
jgi:ribosome-binding protein aMBF1 (putative translation factor)